MYDQQQRSYINKPKLIKILENINNLRLVNIVSFKINKYAKVMFIIKAIIYLHVLPV